MSLQTADGPLQAPERPRLIDTYMPFVHDQNIGGALDFIPVSEETKLRPVGDYILVEEIEVPRASRGGIIAPDRLGGHHGFSLYRVCALGEGFMDATGNLHAINCKIGDAVILGGAKYQLPFRGKQYCLVQSSSILCVIEALPRQESETAGSGNGESKLFQITG